MVLMRGIIAPSSKQEDTRGEWTQRGVDEARRRRAGEKAGGREDTLNKSGG